MKKDKATLAKLLGEARDDGFEQWCDGKIQAWKQDPDPDTAAAARILSAMLKACVKTMQTEREVHQRSNAQSIESIARCFGIATMGAVMSMVKPEGHAELARLLTEDFAEGLAGIARLPPPRKGGRAA